MNILVIGQGGREHALAWKLAQSNKTDTVFVLPGNGGTENEPKCVNVALDINDFEAIKNLIIEKNIKLVVIGPEDPLVNGLVDYLDGLETLVFGPCAKGAQLEGSKIYSKEFMFENGIPTGAANSFTDSEKAKIFLEECTYPIVLKADGLAAGKGVLVAEDLNSAKNWVDAVMQDSLFGSAGKNILIEECLFGTELSFMGILTPKEFIPFETSVDYKPLLDGNNGPNTGGMGCISPSPFMNDELKISNLLYHFGALIFSFYFSKNKSNLISFLFIVFITISIFLTAERANFITMISFIFLLIIYLVFKNKKTFFLYFVIFSLFLSIGFLTNNSLSKRMINDLANKIELLKFDKDENFLKKDSHYFAHYSVAYQIFERNPLFGIGLKNFRNFCDDDSLNEKVHEKWQKRKCSTHPHNFYFEMLSEIGSVGFLIIISFFIFSFYTFFDSYKKNKDTFLLLNCFIILIYFIPFLPKGSFFSNWNAMIFWFVFSFIFSIYNKSLNEKS